MVIDTESRSVTWDNLPPSLELAIEKDFEHVTTYPLGCLNLALSGCIERVEGLRDKAEYGEALKQAIKIHSDNPLFKYQITGQIGSGGVGSVFLATRFSD